MGTLLETDSQVARRSWRYSHHVWSTR